MYALLVRWELKEPYQGPTKPPQILLLVVKHSQKSPDGNGIGCKGCEMNDQRLTIKSKVKKIDMYIWNWGGNQGENRVGDVLLTNVETGARH